MKKILPILAIVIMVFSGLGAVVVSDSETEITETISFSAPTVQRNEEYVNIEVAEATYYTFGYGEPCLPVVNKVYTFPFGTRIDNVEVTFSAAEQQQLSSKVMYAASAQFISTEFSEEYVAPDYETLYTDIDVYPSERSSYKASAGLLDEEHVIYLAVSAYPVQYVPGTNTIYYSDSVDIHVTYTPPETPVIFPDEYDLLIITPVEFESALQPLVDHKNNDLDPPVRTIMVTLDDIPSYGGYDEQEDIKYYIKDSIETWGITYLLLVGAGLEDEGELFPVRYAWLSSPPHEDYFPSDAYYADIYNSTGGFSDWDVDEDGKYAEYSTDVDDMDLIPDVYLGKLPANDVEEVNIVVDKIINYRLHNVMTHKIGQVGGDTFVGDPGEVLEGEYANTKVLEKLPGYANTNIWASLNKLTKPNIRSGWHGNVDFMDLSGHGSVLSWATHPPLDDSTWIPPATIISQVNGFMYMDFDIYLFRNKKLPVVMYNSCSNHKYSRSPDCLGWYSIQKEGGGAIATFAASGIGYGAQGTAEVERVMGWMEVHIFDEMYKNKILGLALGNCLTNYFNTFQSNMQKTDYITLCEFSLFGDPTLPIQDGIDPHPRVSHPLPRLIERLIDRFPLLERIIASIPALN